MAAQTRPARAAFAAALVAALVFAPIDARAQQGPSVVASRAFRITSASPSACTTLISVATSPGTTQSNVGSVFSSLLTITNAGAATTSNITFFDESSPNCNANDAIFGPTTLGQSQIISWVGGYPLFFGLTYQLSAAVTSNLNVTLR